MGRLKRVEGEHPFFTAGFGPAPYLEQGVEYTVRDDEFCLTCDACGQKNLSQKFMFLSSTNQFFGVGSECVKQADGDLSLALKHKYGVKGQVSRKRFEKLQMWNDAQPLLEELLELKPSFADSKESWIVQFQEAFLKNDKKHPETFEKYFRVLDTTLQGVRSTIQREKNRANVLYEIGDAYNYHVNNGLPYNKMDLTHRRIGLAASQQEDLSYVKTDRLERSWAYFVDKGYTRPVPLDNRTNTP